MDAYYPEYQPSADEVADRLSHHLIPNLDPCQDRGVDWPCDVAVVCRFAITDPVSREWCDLVAWADQRFETWPLPLRQEWNATRTAGQMRAIRERVGD